MHAKKLQIALEYMIIFGFVLIVFLLLFTLVATQRAQTLSEQIFSEEQLVAQSVSAQLNRALQAGNGYVARVPITGAIGTLNYQLFVSKNGAVIVNASVGTQLLHVVAYSSVKNLVSSSSFLVPNTFFYQLPISNGTIFIQNSFGAICVDYACPTVSTQASNVTLSSELVHAALFATPNTQVQGIANALPYGTNAISAFAWIRTLATGKETAFSYGGTGSGQAASIDVSQQANTGNFYVDFGSDLADSMTPVNNGVWHFVGFSLASGSTSITLLRLQRPYSERAGIQRHPLQRAGECALRAGDSHTARVRGKHRRLVAAQRGPAGSQRYGLQRQRDGLCPVPLG